MGHRASVRDLWDKIKRSNIDVIGVPEKRGGYKKYVKK